MYDQRGWQPAALSSFNHCNARLKKYLHSAHLKKRGSNNFKNHFPKVDIEIKKFSTLCRDQAGN